MSTSGDIPQYYDHIGECSVHHDAFGGYHEYIGRCSVRRGFQYKSKAFINLLPHMNQNIP